MRWNLVPVLVVCASCSSEPVRETLSIRSGGLNCSERITSPRSGAGRVGITLSTTGTVNSGVSLSLPTNGEQTTEGPSQQCNKALQIAEETAEIDLQIKRAELREALADAQIAEARAKAELAAIKRQTNGLEGVEWS